MLFWYFLSNVFVLILRGLCKCSSVWEVWIHWAGFLNIDAFSCEAERLRWTVSHEKEERKKMLAVCSFRPERDPQTNVVGDAGSLWIYPKAAWKHQALLNKGKASEALCRPDSLEVLWRGFQLISSNDPIPDIVHFLSVSPPLSFVVPYADLSTAKAKKC